MKFVVYVIEDQNYKKIMFNKKMINKTRNQYGDQGS